MPHAPLGRGLQTGHNVVIREENVIGDNVGIWSNSVIDYGCRIGNNVKIQNNVSVYDDVTLEDDVFCGPSAVFTNVVNPRAHVSRKHEYVPTLVRRGATLGANATVVCGRVIGRYAFVGAGAVVTRDVPDHALVIGAPARQTGWICRCGLHLDFSDTNAARCRCGDAYRLRGGICETV